MRGFDHATILSPSCPAWHNNDLPFVLSEKLGGVCSTLPETLTLFQTKIWDFPRLISDLVKNLIPCFRPEALARERSA